MQPARTRWRPAQWLALLLAFLLAAADSAKVLLVPLDHPGHVNLFVLSGQALMKYGHEVHILTNEKFRSKIESSGITPLLYTPKEAVSIADDKQISQGLGQVAQDGFFSAAFMSIGPKLAGRIAEQVEEILANQPLMDRVGREKYDFAVMEGFLAGRPLYAIPYKFDLKYVSIISAVPDAWASHVPAMPSVEPMAILPFSNQMTFMERMVNLFLVLAMNVLLKPFMMEKANFIQRNVPDKPAVTFDELYKRSEMFLNNLEINLMDYPRVSAPHFVYVGGIGGSPAKPLEPELEKYVSGAKNGLIVVSFGSMFQKLPLPLLEKLFTVFEKLPHVNFIMRGEVDSSTKVPTNAKMVKWLPQNDLLGHPKTKVFVTHGGNNGQTEGLYHGVPMVVFPFFGDQPYNARRVEEHGYGRVISVSQDSAEDIAETVAEVLDNPVYAQRIQKASAIKRVLPKANETIAFWTDHVIRFGSDHIRPSYMDMPLYKLFMLDVVAFLCLVWFVVLFISYKLIKMLCRACCKSKSVKKEKSAKKEKRS